MSIQGEDIESQIMLLQDQISRVSEQNKACEDLIAQMDRVDQHVDRLLAFPLPQAEQNHCCQILQRHCKQIQEDCLKVSRVPNSISFDIKTHISECLQTKHITVLRQKIAQSRQQLEALYDRVDRHLQKQEPYIHQKMSKRIRSEVQNYSRERLLSNIRKHQDRLKGWKEDLVDKVVKQSGVGEMNALLVQNITLLGEIRSRKVLANDLIFSEVPRLQRTVDTFRKVPQYIEEIKSRLKARLLRHEVIDQQSSLSLEQQIQQETSQMSLLIRQHNKEASQRFTLAHKGLQQSREKLQERIRAVNSQLN